MKYLKMQNWFDYPDWSSEDVSSENEIESDSEEAKEDDEGELAKVKILISLTNNKFNEAEEDEHL